MPAYRWSDATVALSGSDPIQSVGKPIAVTAAGNGSDCRSRQRVDGDLIERPLERNRIIDPRTRGGELPLIALTVPG